MIRIVESGLGVSAEVCLAFEPLRAPRGGGKCVHALQSRTGCSILIGNREQGGERLQGKLQLPAAHLITIAYRYPSKNISSYMRSSHQGRYVALGRNDQSKT